MQKVLLCEHKQRKWEGEILIHKLKFYKENISISALSPHLLQHYFFSVFYININILSGGIGG